MWVKHGKWKIKKDLHNDNRHGRWSKAILYILSCFYKRMHVWEKISENHAKCVSLDRSDWKVYSVRQDLPLNLQCLLKCNVAFNRNYRSFEMRLLILPDASLQFLKPFNFQSFQTTIPHHHQPHRYYYN